MHPKQHARFCRGGRGGGLRCCLPPVIVGVLIARHSDAHQGGRDGRRLTSSRLVTDDSCLTAQVGWSNVVGLAAVAVAPGAAEDTAPLSGWSVPIKCSHHSSSRARRIGDRVNANSMWRASRRGVATGLAHYIYTAVTAGSWGVLTRGTSCAGCLLIEGEGRVQQVAKPNPNHVEERAAYVPALRGVAVIAEPASKRPSDNTEEVDPVHSSCGVVGPGIASVQDMPGIAFSLVAWRLTRTTVVISSWKTR